MTNNTIHSFSDFVLTDDYVGYRFFKLRNGNLTLSEANDADFVEVWDIHNKHTYYNKDTKLVQLVLQQDGFHYYVPEEAKLTYFQQQELGTSFSSVMLADRTVLSNIICSWKVQPEYSYVAANPIAKVHKTLINKDNLTIPDERKGFVKLWNGLNDNIYDVRYYTFVPKDEIPNGYVKLVDDVDVYAPVDSKNVIAVYENNGPCEDEDDYPCFYVSLTKAVQDYCYSELSKKYWACEYPVDFICKFYPNGSYETMTVTSEEIETLDISDGGLVNGFLVSVEALKQAQSYNLYEGYVDEIYDYHDYCDYHPSNLDEDDDDNIYYGIEIETEGKRKNSFLIDEWQLFHCERDSSLKTGFEIISQPMSWKYLLSQENFIKETFKELKEHGQTADDEETCGLHVHVSVEAFKNENSIERTKAIVAGFKENIEKLARRPQNSYCGYLKVDGKKIKKKDIKKQFHGRYVAVNDTNEDTVEFRMFQSTLDYDTLMASIELVRNIIDLANSDKEVVEFRELISEGEHLVAYASKFDLKLDEILDFSEWENELD